MINLHLSDDSALATVTVAGAVTIDTSEDLRLALVEAFTQSKHVALDLRNVEDFDLSATQVICSACKTAAALKRSFGTAGKLPECIINLGKNLGAPQGVPCLQNDNTPCNWFGGVE